MDYHKKIFVVQGKAYETDLALCEWDAQSNAWVHKQPMTESRYNILLMKKEFQALVFLASYAKKYTPGSPEWRLITEAKLIVEKMNIL